MLRMMSYLWTFIKLLIIKKVKVKLKQEKHLVNPNKMINFTA